MDACEYCPKWRTCLGSNFTTGVAFGREEKWCVKLLGKTFEDLPNFILDLLGSFLLEIALLDVHIRLDLERGLWLFE